MGVSREKAELRARLRERLSGMEERLERPGPARRRPGAEQRRGAWGEVPEEDRAPRSPLAGLLLLVVLPLVWPLLLLGRRAELRHESWAFRLHDLAARRPTLGLALYLGGAFTLALALSGTALLCVLYGLPLLRQLPWWPW